MNREILFRGKRVDNGEWLYGDLARSTSSFEGKEYNHVLIGNDWDYEEVIPETIGQFTGLTDKNGTKIFEWDVVRWDDNSNGEYWRIAIVKINPSLVFDCLGVLFYNGIKNSSYNTYDYGNFIYKDTHNHLEIIGNIHDK